MTKPINPQWGWAGEWSTPAQDAPVTRQKARCCVVNPTTGEQCPNPVQAHGWCSGHYQRWYYKKDVQADKPLRVLVKGGGSGPCIVDGCKRKAKSGGLCSTHYMRKRNTGDVNPQMPVQVQDLTKRYVPVMPEIEEPVTNQLFREWWNRLTNVQREVVNMRCTGMTIPDIAQKLGAGESTMHKHSGAAIQSLMEMVGRDRNERDIATVCWAHGYNSALDRIEKLTKKS